MRLFSKSSIAPFSFPSGLSSFSSIKDRIARERQARLLQRTEALPTELLNPLSKTRNIGIIAHIDAGKTTVTERMLFYSGALLSPGEVHDGNTVMDYMEQERERGITIRSAAISFLWDDCHVNLIDTPGHIDFNGEVERSLRVLDGAITIFDALKGVETQSECVWEQANKYSVPRISFINKMDRPGSEIEQTVEDLQKKLGVDPFVIHYPIIKKDQFVGVVDLIDLEKIIWTDDYGIRVLREPLDPVLDKDFYAEAMRFHEQLIDKVSLSNDRIAEMFLSGSKIPTQLVKQTIQSQMAKFPNQRTAVLCGSALKNKGIQTLLQGVIEFLPSPLDRPPAVAHLKRETSEEKSYTVTRRPEKKEKLLGLVFKHLVDPLKGAVAYMRIYSGTINSKTLLYNTAKEKKEKISAIFRVRANEYVEMSEATAGDIVALTGLTNTASGDTIIEASDLEQVLLERIVTPQPVFTYSVEPETQKDKKRLLKALEDLSKEDSTIEWNEDEENGQTLMSGLGELHLEIIKDRLETEFNLKVTMHKPRVSNKESIQQETSFEYEINKKIGNKIMYGALNLTVSPLEDKDFKIKNHMRVINVKSKDTTNQIIIDIWGDIQLIKYYEEYVRRQILIEKRKRGRNGDEDEEDEFKDLPGEKDPLKQLHFIENPIKMPESNERVSLDNGTIHEDVYDIRYMSFKSVYAIEKVLINGMRRGPLAGFPLCGIRVVVSGGSFTEKYSDEKVMEMVASQGLLALLAEASPCFLEPVMKITVSTPNEFLQPLLNDLIMSKRGNVLDVLEEKSVFTASVDVQRSTIYARVPLVELIGYATKIRSMSRVKNILLVFYLNLFCHFLREKGRSIFYDAI